MELFGKEIGFRTTSEASIFVILFVENRSINRYLQPIFFLLFYFSTLSIDKVKISRYTEKELNLQNRTKKKKKKEKVLQYKNNVSTFFLSLFLLFVYKEEKKPKY